MPPKLRFGRRRATSSSVRFAYVQEEDLAAYAVAKAFPIIPCEPVAALSRPCKESR